MFHKIKFLALPAVALLAGALLASPALAQRTGGAIPAGVMSARPRVPAVAAVGYECRPKRRRALSAGPSLGAVPSGGNRGGSVNAARGSGPARVGGNPNYAYNGRHHRHHRDHDGISSALVSSAVPTVTTMTILGPMSRIATCAACTSITTGCCAATATERTGATGAIANADSRRCRRGAAGITFCK